MSDREPDFFHNGEEWSAVAVPGSGTMMLLPPDSTEARAGGQGSNDVACPWCGFSTAQSMVCDRCGSPLPDGQSSFWSLVDAAS